MSIKNILNTIDDINTLSACARDDVNDGKLEDALELMEEALLKASKAVRDIRDLIDKEKPNV